jgi:hypothetical protein
MKTPIEYLIEKLTESGHLWLTDKPSDMDELVLIIKKAKEMEKQQLGECWDAALDAYERRAGVWVRASEDFDEYYEDRFK